jgi:DNA-binding MarR family transcriptional regulator
MENRTPAGAAATEVILSVFKVNGLLVTSGDQLSASEDLTSARWQVLGAIALADRPLTVPQIARRMGLTRQSVHATVKRLVEGGLVELLPNADHRRSRLVRLTDLGERRYAAIDSRQIGWVNRLTHGLGRTDLEMAARVLQELSARLEAEDETERVRNAA